MIHLCREPDFPLRIFAPELASSMREEGLSTKIAVVGRDGAFSGLRRHLPPRLARFLFSVLHTHCGARTAMQNVHANDVVLVYETASIANRLFDMAFQKKVKQIGARYIPIFPDAWLLSKSWLAECCERRVALADVIGCVTPSLVNLFKTRFPSKQVELFEEAVPTDDFAPICPTNRLPCICWSGPPSKIGEVKRMVPILEKVHSRYPFSLRIVSGKTPPKLITSFPVDWRPFSGTDYRYSFQDVDIAFAVYPDTPYGQCKGNYKIKTYMAAGCAIVTSPVGYNLDLIRPGNTGLFAKGCAEWKAAFLRLLENPEERFAMRKAARAEAIRRFSYAAIAKQYAGVLAPLRVE